MRIAREPRELAPFFGGVLVPTMGGLHAGHAALVRHAADIAGAGRAVVVSVFVNPTQFDVHADFDRYPRDLDADALVCERAGATCLFAPPAEAVYPPGRDVAAGELPMVATAPGLEDAQRPGHFAGVCQVVRRLFELARPERAIFGEKDWQQLQVVRAMVRAGSIPVEIIGRPIVREADGLAMSSRNRFLSAAERSAATSLVGALRGARHERDAAGAERAMRRTMEGAGVAVDYAAVRDAVTLAPLRAGGAAAAGAARALVAGRLGSVRLLDNMEWP